MQTLIHILKALRNTFPLKNEQMLMPSDKDLDIQVLLRKVAPAKCIVCRGEQILVAIHDSNGTIQMLICGTHTTQISKKEKVAVSQEPCIVTDKAERVYRY